MQAQIFFQKKFGEKSFLKKNNHAKYDAGKHK